MKTRIEYAREIADARRGCAWKGCTASYGGALPAGWCNLMTDSSPELLTGDAFFNALELDGVLCPLHKRALYESTKVGPFLLGRSS